MKAAKNPAVSNNFFIILRFVNDINMVQESKKQAALCLVHSRQTTVYFSQLFELIRRL